MTRDFATFEELQLRATKQRNTFAYRVLPLPIYQWFADNEIINLEDAKADRESAVQQFTEAISDAEMVLWKGFAYVDNIQSRWALFPQDIRGTIAEIDAQRSQFQSRRDRIPDSLLRPEEHARLYQVERRFQTVINELQAVVCARGEVVDHIRKTLAHTHCSLLQANAVLEQFRENEQTFSEIIYVARRMLSESQCKITDFVETYPLSVIRPIELGRLFSLQSQAEEINEKLSLIVEKRQTAVQKRLRLQNDLCQVTWKMGARAEKPPLPSKIAPQIEQIKEKVDSLRAEIADTDPWTLTPEEHARGITVLNSATRRLRSLKNRYVFEQTFRAVRHQFATLIRELNPHLQGDKYWSETDHREACTRLDILTAQLQALQLWVATFDNITVDAERVLRVQDQVTAARSHEQLNVNRFRRIRGYAVRALYERLTNIEVLYWDRKERIKTLEQSGSWSEKQRSQVAPDLITQVECDLRLIEATLSDLPPMGVRPCEYGLIHGYQLRLESELRSLKRRVHAERVVHDVSQIYSYVISEGEPYLDHEKLCPESTLTELKERLAEGRSELDKLCQSVTYDELSETVRDRITALSDQVDQYHEHFANYNREYVARQVKEALGEFATQYDRLERQLHPARKHGELLPDDIHSQKRQVHAVADKLSELTQPSTGQYISDTHQKKISRAQTNLEETQGFIQQKEAFEEEMEQYRAVVQQVSAQAAPFLSYEKFLTRRASSRLTKLIRDTRSQIEDWQNEFDFSVLASADKEKPDRLIENLNGIATHISNREEYNQKFTEAARDRNADLFTDIDADNNDLTLAQQRAIVRNGVFNQVVAGAGTGKTLALIYRIAYLVSRKGIDPGRIAVVTLTNKATEEIKTRLAERFGITDVQVQNLHSFGLDIINDATTENVDITSDGLRNQLDRYINDDGHTPFKMHLRQFVQHDQIDYLKEDDFETRADYIAERANKDYLTVAGEEVASRAEKVIADFLFEHQIQYRYEDVAEWADTAPDKRPYKPDFHLPEHGIYIEHWAIDEDGEVPPWFNMSTADYHQKRTWAREQFDSADATLVETYDSTHRDGDLREHLGESLSSQGVELELLSFEELVDHAYEYHETIKSFMQQLEKFVENAKIFSKSPDDIRDTVRDAGPRLHHFGHCGAYALEEYQSFLQRTDQLDFQDLLSEATAAIERHPDRFKERFDHLLVDEFQDVSVLGHELISTLVPPNQDEIRLFTVGDDWQSIYGFRGAVVKQFVEFEEMFGHATQTKLTRNHRCPDPIVQAGNQLLSNNPDQIQKTVEPAGKSPTEPVLHTLNGKNGHDRDYRQRVGQYVASLINSFIDDGVAPQDIMILCRFDQGARYLNRVKKSLKSECIPFDGRYEEYRPDNSPSPKAADGVESGGVDIHSIHQAKGREAERVVLVHVASGAYGLPSDRDRGKLLSSVRDVEVDHVAEERRLFYVGMTRAEDELHITTRRNQRSEFLDEVSEWLDEKRTVAYPGPHGWRTSLTAKVNQLWDPHRKQHQTGLLTDPTGSIKFVTWSDGNPPTLEEGRWYRLDEVKIKNTEKYGMELIIDKMTVVEDPIDTN